MLHQFICCFSLQKDYWQKNDRKWTFSANKCLFLWNIMSKPQSKPTFRNFLRSRNTFNLSCYHWIMFFRENAVVLLENKWFRWVRIGCTFPTSPHPAPPNRTPILFESGWAYTIWPKWILCALICFWTQEKENLLKATLNALKGHFPIFH